MRRLLNFQSIWGRSWFRCNVQVFLDFWCLIGKISLLFAWFDRLGCHSRRRHHILCLIIEAFPLVWLGWHALAFHELVRYRRSLFLISTTIFVILLVLPDRANFATESVLLRRLESGRVCSCLDFDGVVLNPIYGGWVGFVWGTFTIVIR